VDDITAESSAPNLWTSIWTEPRATIRYLINTDPSRGVLVLAILGGTAQSLSRAIEHGMGEQLSIAAILLFAGTIGPAFGVLTLYIGSYVLQWTGRWIGGEGSLTTIRTALGWANVPMVFHLAITLFMIPVLGQVLFRSEEAKVQLLGAGGSMAFLLYGLAALVLGIWSFVILLKGLGEVQGFSAWKAWGNVILALLPVVVLGIVAALLIPRLA
jgi:hypothetical protein